MDFSAFNVLNFNASRTSNLSKIENFLSFLDPYDPIFVSIQEINIFNALKVFSKKFQVLVNIENDSKDGIGIVSLVKKGIPILDSIIGLNGRIIGLKLRDIQLWNVYPQSGSGFKASREKFFREDLCSLMMNWKDSTKYIIELGDHNCIHRDSDSLHNSAQHLQPGLIKHMQIHGLSDDFLNIHGDIIMYSRISNISSTRIDYILSNTNACSYFQYVDMLAGLDHKVAIARYDIPITVSKEFIPNDRYFSGWVISKQLEFDESFLRHAKLIFESVFEESNLSVSGLDPSFYWLKSKTALISCAKFREKELYKEEKFQIDLLNGFYSSIVLDIQDGRDCLGELNDIKQKLDSIYQERSKRKVDKMRGIEIDNSTYDIHKLQNQRKFENQSKINEIKIGDSSFQGTPEVVKAIEVKMKSELKQHGEIEFNAPPTPMEEVFLSKLKPVVLSEEEKSELLSPTNQEEISYILEHEVDLDSSPGEDGITYRFIKLFWKWPTYRDLYLKYLNFTRASGSCGLLENFGIMTVKNKKVQSIEYNKKRKLTKLNKDTNLGNGKVWTNRLKRVLIPKILPKTQFNCQADVNIIDEVREIRSVNLFLLGDDVWGQIDGTILSIDFKDAFRSTSLRWFNLVMTRLEVPQEFIDWFWAMYSELFIVLVINRYKSEKIFIHRGFMEGHPPSMAAFVISLIPLMCSLEEVMVGIKTPDDKNHKIKMFADDLKVFISDLGEIDSVYDVICKFETVSGLEMHRDRSRDKCQALPFGNHRDNVTWPAWVSVKKQMKVVGAIFSNDESLEKLNSELVFKCFNLAYQKSWGIKGTIFQKAYFVNTFLFTKLWYTAQFFKLDEKMIKKMIVKAFSFIYAGENERPVRPLNYRSKFLGGLGLINPIIKAKSLLIKNMYSDFLLYDCSISDGWIVNNLYGYTNDFVKVFAEGLAMAPVKLIYNFLLQGELYKNGSLIPSRNEKRSLNVKWSLVWNNLALLKGLTAEEKCFAWKVSQDMVAVGSRKHRKNAERRCLRVLETGLFCHEIENLEHLFAKCKSVSNAFSAAKLILESFLGRPVSFNDIIHLVFNHRNKKRLICALWFSVKIMFKIFQDKCVNKIQLLKEVIKDIDWNLKLNRKLGSLGEILSLKNKIEMFL